MNVNVIDALAQHLVTCYPDLSMDEGRIIAHAYIFRNSTMPVMTGNPRTPPDGHLDSTIGLGFLDSPGYMAQYCQALVVGDYLCEHPTEAGMVRISDCMIPVCERIINDL